MNQVIWKLENSDKKLRLGEIIGEGATATVLLANDMDDESIKYAVKRFDKSEMNAYDIADYKREALILKKLAGHPNIVKFIGSFEAAQHYYLLLEYCETDLFDSIFLKCGLPSNVVKKLFSDITAGIDYCHRNEIYHRDIKPENILISNNGTRAKLADFGLATFDKYTDEFGVGSDRYMAPECLDSDDEKQDSAFIDCYSSPAADVWALGVLLLNMIFGRSPWHIASLTDSIFGAYIGCDPLILQRTLKLPLKFDNFIRQKVFNLEPDERCSVIEFNLFVQSLDKFTDEEKELTSQSIECVTDGDKINIFRKLNSNVDNNSSKITSRRRGSLPTDTVQQASITIVNHMGSVDMEKLSFSSARLDNLYVETKESRIQLIKKLGLGSSSVDSNRTITKTGSSNKFV